MALALDTNASSHAMAAQATVQSKAATISTNQTNDIIVVWAAAYNGATGVGANAFTVSDTAGLSWTRRGTMRLTGTFGQVVELWWALAPSTLSSDTITATIGGGVNMQQITIAAFAINGADTTTPFDTNVSLPATSVTASAGSCSVTISTTTADDMLISFEQSSGGTQNVPTSFTKIDGNIAFVVSLADGQWIVTGTKSSSTINGANPGTVDGLFVDAIRPATGSAGGFGALLSDRRSQIVGGGLVL